MFMSAHYYKPKGNGNLKTVYLLHCGRKQSVVLLNTVVLILEDRSLNSLSAKSNGAVVVSGGEK